jgi:hypothetical protein
MSVDPVLNVALFEFCDRLPAVAGQVVQKRNGPVSMAAAHRTGSYAPFAVLQVFGADTSHDPVLVGGRYHRLRLARELGSSQGILRDLAIITSSNAFAVLVEQSHSFPCAQQGLAPAAGLLPMPSRTVRVASLCARSSHALISWKKLTCLV